MQTVFDLFLPKTQWTLQPPPEVPDDVDLIALDTETNDPGLTENGPGFLRGNGHVAGVSFAFRSKSKGLCCGYLPIGHKIGPNLSAAQVGDWLSGLVLRRRHRFVFANQFYDTGWLRTLGVEFIPDTCDDVLIMAALEEEERPNGYGLDDTCKFYKLPGKDERALRDAADWLNQDAKKDMWKMPPQFVGDYACGDAEQTLLLFEILVPRLKQQQLEEVWQLERDLTPILLEISHRGVPVDLKAAAQLNDAWIIKEKAMRAELGNVDIWSGPALAALLKKHGLSVPLTEKGNPSVNKDVLRDLKHPVVDLIQNCRALNRCRQTYVEDLILRPNRDIIHPEFIQIARDEGGTRTGRLACMNPNLQQIPVRNKAIEAWRVRSLFVPPEGFQWAKADYNSQEPRLQIHYALLQNLPGAPEAAAVFARGEKLYHYLEKVAGINYDEAKQAMLARSYGQQAKSFARANRRSESEAEQILDSFDEYCPYVSDLAERLQERARERGYIRTLSGRRRHFNWWEPDRWAQPLDPQEYFLPVYGLEEARQVWPNRPIRRAYTNKAFNALIQGGSADMTKRAMIALHRAGIPVCLQVHDELNAFVRNEEQGAEMKRLMEQVYQLRIPIVADMKVGGSWK